MVSLKEAIQAVAAFRSDWGIETIPLDQSLRRVLAEDIFADRDYPPFNRSAMDGYAIRWEDIITNRIVSFTIIGEIFAGDNKTFKLRSGEAVKIMTGAAVPDDANAVIKKEDAVQSGNVVSFTVEQCLPYQHIARKGGDVLKNGLSITKNRQINAGALSALASLGRSNIRVFRLPRVAILSTGNEITSVDVPITKHQIRDSNSFFIAGFLQHYSITPVIKKIIQDDVESLISNIEAVKDCDILILSGGVSAGDADFVPDALERCGVQALFHKVKIKPGKPIWFGHHTNGLTVFALPGNPFSVQVASNIFIEPYLRSCFHLPPVTPFRLPINVTRKKKVSIDEFFPAKYAHEGALEISPIVFNGSGDITAIVHSHGIVHHPSAANDLMQDDLVDFYPWEKFTDQ